MALIAIALLLAAGQAGGAAPPDAAAIRAAAARCRLPDDWLHIGHDEDGDYADPSPAHRDAPIAPVALVCIIRWAGETHARLGLMSEPPPGPQALATVPHASSFDVSRGAEQCNLPVRIDPLDAERGMLLARRHAPPAQLACMRAWLAAHGMAPG